MDIDSILKSYQRFGVHLGLERISRLLADLGNPHHSVPVIHVAGTNGKGSVCAYLSAVLTSAGYRVGRYTSPHLVDWTERICLNEQPIVPEALRELLLQVQDAIGSDTETPTQFEVITAAAWLYFAQQQVDVAVVEVGLGGRLDATNVCSRPLVSIITSISREHWQQLGPKVADIAREKAGILKAGCPAVVGPVPPEATEAIAQRIAELGCPAVFPASALWIEQGWAEYQGIKYPLPLLGDIQLTNSALALAALQILNASGWEISEQAIASGMAKTKWPGRLQWTIWKNHRLLIDGAHNQAAAQALRQYVDTCGIGSPPFQGGVRGGSNSIGSPPFQGGVRGGSKTWIMGMLSTKDHAEIFEALLRSGDRLYLVPVPEPSSASPQYLATLAINICPELDDCRIYSNLVNGLEAATSTATPENLLVLCGSLYLLGHFLKIAG